MVWGGNDGAVDRWVKQLEENDPALGSLHILSFRRISTHELGRIFTALINNTTLRELYISGHKLDAQCVDQLSEALTLNTTLKSLNIGNSMFGEDTAVFGLFCEGLAVNEGLVKLDLENKGLLSSKDNYKSIKILAESLSKNKTLEELNLARNDLDNQAMEILSPALMNLIRINLSINNIGPAGVQVFSKKALDKTSHIEELDLSDNPLLEGTVALAEALHTNKSLRVLKLTDVVSSPVSAESLPPLPAAALDPSKDKLEEEKKDNKERTVYGNSLADAMGRALQFNTCLNHLSLDNNAIESSALHTLAKNLHRSSLLQLKLRDNLIDDEGAHLLSEAIGISKLNHLELGVNTVGPKGFGSLLNTSLNYLGLFNNKVNGFGSNPSEFPSLESSAVSHLDLGCNGINHQDLEAMVDVLLKKGVPQLKLWEMAGNVDDKEMGDWESTIERLLAERAMEVIWKRRPTDMENIPPPQTT
ncbi:hypothetical protein BDB01DRAFT_783163 [Pilobolus umbonatus]|nr:hypothetical protein BDB01DRAFT_783163 [Pilobolus umbonatus]